MKKINFKKLNSLIFSLIIVFSFFTTNIKIANAVCNVGLVLSPQGECIPQITYDTLYGNGGGGSGSGFGVGGGVNLNPQNTYKDEPYQPLAPLPGYPDGGFKFTAEQGEPEPCPLGQFMNTFIDIFIGIVAILSMIMIVMGGIEYVMSDLVTSKEEAKSRIQNAILGLILSLSIYIILNTVNPNLLNLCLDVPNKSITIKEGIAGDENAGNFTPISKDKLESLGVKCPGSGGAGALPSIARSFAGKVSYDQSKRGKISGNTIYLDCSSFVSQVYACAGLSSPGNTTATMFNNNNKTGDLQNSSSFLTNLAVGDLLGWRKGESTKYESAGHVVMYLGNGKFIEVNSQSGVTERSLGSYTGNYYHLIKPKTGGVGDGPGGGGGGSF